MQQQLRPIPAREAAASSWGVAALVGVATFALLRIIGDWTFLQAAFAGGVVLLALGGVIAVSVGRVLPADALDHRPPTRRMGGAEQGLAVDLEAMRPRDLNAPSPHRTDIERSMISDARGHRGLSGRSFRQPIRGTIETAPATLVPAPAPINASDPGVARPVGATANARPMAQPAPLNGRIVAPEPPLPFEGEAPGRISRNEAALAGGAAVTVRPTATHSVQSYNEPGRGDDTVEASSGTLPDSSPASDDRSARMPSADDPAPIPGPPPAESHPAEVEGEKPMTLDAPRGGSGDDLKKIRGIGPKLEDMLNAIGFWHFDQIASWTDREAAWVDQHLEGFKGRVTRDDWVAQARALAAEAGSAPAGRVGDADAD
ncbi:hypothetical protein [Jannaschia formosa]|uniref:hypothetical protein n=1 Tax=Jannaschia formosa TaxID=2259592 RepID=UPI001ADDB73F|nr:hypothetical protein [Jannaschia formosa]